MIYLPLEVSTLCGMVIYSSPDLKNELKVWCSSHGLNYQTIIGHLDPLLYVTYSWQCSNVLLFGTARLRLTREQIENRLYIHSTETCKALMNIPHSLWSYWGPRIIASTITFKYQCNDSWNNYK